jgi:hypothetical protein
MGDYSTAVASRRFFTTGLVAASAGILILSLVTAPPKMAVAVPRAGIEVVQLAAAMTAEVSIAAVNTVVRPASAAVTPASLAQDVANGLITIAGVALGVVIAPIWYLAFPVTLPFSYKLAQIPPGLFCELFTSPTCTSPPPPPPTQQQVLQDTIGIFLLTPFVLGVLGVTLFVAGILQPAASGVQTTPKTAKAQIRATTPAQPTASFKPQSSSMAGNGKLMHQVPSAASTNHTHSTSKAH